jgi:hypothetical protein
VAERADLVGDGVRVLVEFTVNRRKTDHRGLSSLNHGEPDDGNPKHAEGKRSVDIRRELGLIGEDQGRNNDDREDEKDRRVDVLKHREGISLEVHGGRSRGEKKILQVQEKVDAMRSMPRRKL